MFQSTSAQVWGQRLDRFDQTEMTVDQFCLQEGVSRASLYQWRRKLRGNNSANKNGRRTSGQPTNGQRTNGKANTPPSFLPVSVPTPRSTPLPIPTTTPTSPLTPPTLMTVELPGGVRIRLEFPTDHEQAIPTEARS